MSKVAGCRKLVLRRNSAGETRGFCKAAFRLGLRCHGSISAECAAPLRRIRDIGPRAVSGFGGLPPKRDFNFFVEIDQQVVSCWRGPPVLTSAALSPRFSEFEMSVLSVSFIFNSKASFRQVSLRGVPAWARPGRVFLACLALGISGASAQPRPGFYVGGLAGVDFGNSVTSESGNTVTALRTGPVGILSFGYAFANGLRAEIEGDYRSHGVSSILTRRISGALLPMYDVHGSPSTYGFMANALYDIPLGNMRLPFRPYVGGGIGYSRIDYGDVVCTGPILFPVVGGGSYPGIGTRTSGSSGAFAYQAIAGVAVPVGSIPGLEFSLEYRYFATTHATLPTNTHTAVAIPYYNVQTNISNFTKVAAGDSAVLVGFHYALEPR